MSGFVEFFNRRFRDAKTSDVLGILVGISVIALLVSALANFYNENSWIDWVEATLQNFGTEIIGAIATYALFELVIGRRNEQRRLITQMRSSDIAIAKIALEQIRDNGGLFDGSLNTVSLHGLKLPKADLKDVQMQGAKLDMANLQGADLSSAVLERASLHGTDLSGAIFRLANLQGADLQDAILTGADLRLVDLQGASLHRAQLVNAQLFQAKLQSADFASANLTNAFLIGANLQDANLMAAQLTGARLDPTTILPDGTNWTPQVDMDRFTSADHPIFWKHGDTREEMPTAAFKRINKDDI